MNGNSIGPLAVGGAVLGSVVGGGTGAVVGLGLGFIVAAIYG